jgi:type III secretion protein T
MSSIGLAIDALSPHILAMALIGARLVPVAFLCPLLGGPQTPTQVKLGVVLALGGFLHFGAAIAPPPGLGAMEAVGWAAEEAALGTTLGLVASLPFDAARMGGRFLDLFRGSSAEAALPLAGTKEAATGDLLHSLLLGLAAVGPAFPAVLRALLLSFRWAPLGGPASSEALALETARLVGGAVATGLAIGAPVAALSLTLDALGGLAARATPGLSLQEVTGPLRILAGAVVLWAASGPMATRLEDLLLETPDALHRLFLDAQ